MSSQLIKSNRYCFLKLESKNDNQFPYNKIDKEETDKHIVSRQSSCRFVICQLSTFAIEGYTAQLYYQCRNKLRSILVRNNVLWVADLPLPLVGPWQEKVELL